MSNHMYQVDRSVKPGTLVSNRQNLKVVRSWDDKSIVIRSPGRGVRVFSTHVI